MGGTPDDRTEAPIAALAAQLDALRAADLYRQRATIESRGGDGTAMVVAGRRYTAFCSNDYLALATHPQLRQAFVAAAERHGVGSGASHLVTGHSVEHAALEQRLAEFTGRERALVFSTGYMANLGIVTALTGRGDAVFEDRLNHASLIDAGRLAGARLLRYAHAEPAALARRLKRTPARHRLIATDGVFSMDGDIAPLAALGGLATEYRAWLLVDDAHGLGVVGPTGRGSVDAAGLGAGQVPILMGTLGKALGTFGAFVAGPAALIETLIQRSRSYIYTTALPPAVAAAARAALDLVEREPWRRERLAALIERFRRGAAERDLPLAASTTPIQPLLLGEPAAALAASAQLRARGYWVTAIRPPTVAAGSARLRITLSAGHTEQQVDGFLDSLAEALRGVRPGR